MPNAAREPEFGTLASVADGALLAALTGAVYVEPARVVEPLTEAEEREADDELKQEVSLPVTVTAPDHCSSDPLSRATMIEVPSVALTFHVNSVPVTSM